MLTALTESYWPAEQSGSLDDVTVGGLLRRTAAAVPERTALVEGIPDAGRRRRWTYAELLAESERTARALLARFDPGDHVAVWAPNIPEWVVLEFGAALAGMVLVTVNPAFKPAELAYVLQQSKAAGIFLTPEFRGNRMLQALDSVRGELPHLEEVISFDDWQRFLDSGDPARALPEPTPLDVVQIQYTSGTTGFPKGAMLRHRGIVNNAKLSVERMEIPEGGAWVNPMPLFHTGGCVLGALGCLWMRGTHVLLLSFDPALALELIETERAVSIGAVPTMQIALLEAQQQVHRDVSSLHRLLAGGSLMPAPLVERVEQTYGARFCNMYGQTECSPVATMIAPDDSLDDKAHTVGRALPYTEVRIVDPATGDTVPCGSVGEICTRGYHVMLGYHDNPQATAEAIDADGWLHTGDLGAMDERGYVRIEGRLKDMIIRGGENIYPREIEDMLFKHPAVAEAAVVGIPDETWGEQVAAFVRRAHDDVTGRELFAWCRQHLAPYKAPTRWVFVETFPLTASGKVQKFVLRKQFVEGAFAASVEVIRGGA
jgi:fatty-acyl-CoA synthase